MGPVVLNNNWTEVLLCIPDEINSLFKVKISSELIAAVQCTWFGGLTSSKSIDWY